MPLKGLDVLRLVSFMVVVDPIDQRYLFDTGTGQDQPRAFFLVSRS